MKRPSFKKTCIAVHWTNFLLAIFTLQINAAELPKRKGAAQEVETPLTITSNVMPQLFVPGFIVRELPLELTSLNNVEYAADERLFAGGYDGRFHLLQDMDGDGLEDRIETFWLESGPNYPLGMVVKDGDPHALLADELVRFRDTDGNGVPDKRETVIKDFDDPALVADLNNLVHRDYASVLRDVLEPNAAINPDTIGYNVRLDNGEVITGTRVGETSELLSVAQAVGIA